MYFLDEDDEGALLTHITKEVEKLKLSCQPYGMPRLHKVVCTFNKHPDGSSGLYFNIRLHSTEGRQESIRIGGFTLNPYPANCGAVILSEMGISDRFRSKGIGKLLLACVDAVVDEMGYTHLSCTAQTEYQSRFISLALKNGFKEIDSFFNKRSDNDITILSKLY